MENLIDQVAVLVYRHTDMLNCWLTPDEEEELGNIEYELVHLWKMQQDQFGFFEFDKLPDGYSVRPSLYEDGTCVWFTEHLPTKYVWWSWSTYQEAVDEVAKKVQQKKEDEKKISSKVEEFQEIVKKNSLDERYKDKVIDKKAKPAPKTLGYLENLQKKTRERTEEMHASIEQWRAERNRKLANADYMEALLNH